MEPAMEPDLVSLGPICILAWHCSMRNGVSLVRQIIPIDVRIVNCGVEALIPHVGRMSQRGHFSNISSIGQVRCEPRPVSSAGVGASTVSCNGARRPGRSTGL